MLPGISWDNYYRVKNGFGILQIVLDLIFSLPYINEDLFIS